MHYKLNEKESFILKKDHEIRCCLILLQLKCTTSFMINTAEYFSILSFIFPPLVLKSTVFRTQYTIFSYLIHILLDRFLEADWGDKPISYKMPHII